MRASLTLPLALLFVPACSEPTPPAPAPRLMSPSKVKAEPAKTFEPAKTIEPALPLKAPTPDPVKAHFAERARLDRTLWQPEVLAQAHEQVFVQLWDALRGSPDPVAVLAAFPFEQIGLPKLKEASGGQGRLRRLVHSGPLEWLDRAGWKARLAEWSKGSTLEQSEWHHARFEPAGEGPARSLVKAELHLRRGDSKWRLGLKLEVTWKRQMAEDAGGRRRYVPARIAVKEVDALGGGRPIFEQMARLPLGPHRPQTLIAADLNADGKTELLSPLGNIVLIQKGDTFAPGPVLSPHLLPGASAAILAELTGDLHPDLLATAHRGARTVLALYPGNEGGRFGAPQIVFDPPETLRNVRLLTVGDIDGDGDADVFVPQYRGAYNGDRMPTPFHDARDSWPAFLLRNDGGRFTDVTEASGLNPRTRHTQSASFFDPDRDGDLDLLTVNDFAGVDLHRNDGTGRFTLDREAFDNPTLFGMSHALGDFDADGRLDLFAIGMNSTTVARLNALGLERPDRTDDTRWRTQMTFGNRLYRGSPRGTFALAALAPQVARSGWAWGVTALDLENDGDLDLFVANGFMSGRTAQDYCTRFWSHDVYLDESIEPSTEDGIIDTLATQIESGVSWNGFEHNKAFVRTPSGSVEAGFPLGLGGEADGRNVIADDLDGDGRVDLVIAESHRGRLSARIMRNVAPPGRWIAARLARPIPWGAEVTLRTDRGARVAAVVTGDSFAAQHRPVVHFGLGAAKPLALEVRWPGGDVTRLATPGEGRVHVLR